MSPRDRIGLLGAGLLALTLPACGALPVTRPVAMADSDSEYAQGPYSPTMPAVAVSRPVAAARVRTAEPPLTGWRLEPPTPMPVEVVPARAELPAIEPVRVTAISSPAPEKLPVADQTAPALPAQAPPPAAKPDTPLVEAVRCYQNKSPDQAAQHLRNCDPTSRELLACLLPLAVRLGEGDLAQADPQDLAALVEQVQALMVPLRERAALEVPKLCFCRPVTSQDKAGVYELLDANHLFRPGEMVALYMEVRNFTCAAHGGDYRTHVATAVEVQDERGHVVYQFKIDRSEPSLSPRQDFSNGVRFALPPLPAGAYTLWLKATDLPTGRTARRSLDFRVTTVPARQG